MEYISFLPSLLQKKTKKIVSFRKKNLSYFLAHASFVYHRRGFGLLHNSGINHALEISDDIMICCN